MGEPTNGDQKDSSATGSDGQTHRRTRKRKRTILNLGMPFVQVDDFLNQSEDAVAVGYRVLEQTVQEIQKGYEEAKEFNRKQRSWDGTGPAPTIPWEQLVERVQGFQKIAMDAINDGTDIFFESIKSGTKSVKNAAKTWEQTRVDVEAKPMLAGPIFEQLIEITAVAGGAEPDPVKRRIRHRGLTRLRIRAAMAPQPKELRASGESSPDGGSLTVQYVSFEPEIERDDKGKIEESEEYSVLKIVVGPVAANQKIAVYDGLIRAENFELLIAKLRVHVVAGTSDRAAAGN
jgi:hypothetical protein